MAHKHDVDQLFANDAQLAARKAELAHYLTLASEQRIAAVKQALEQKHQAKVIVVNTKEEALKALIAELPAGASISAAGSHTLTTIGYDEWAKQQKGHRDFKAESLAKYGTPEGADLRRQGLSADYFFTSVTAISEEGELYAVDLTGTRTGGFLASKNLVVVAGTQKLVKDHAEVVKRTEEFCLAVESARVRDAYKIPASSITNVISLKGKSPFDPAPRLTVILVRQVLGF